MARPVSANAAVQNQQTPPRTPPMQHMEGGEGGGRRAGRKRAGRKRNKNKKDAFNDNSAEKVEENEALVQEMIKNGEVIEDDDWGLQSFVAKSLGIDSKREFVLPPNSQSSDLVNAKRRCVCCVCSSVRAALFTQRAAPLERLDGEKRGDFTPGWCKIGRN